MSSSSVNHAVDKAADVASDLGKSWFEIGKEAVAASEAADPLGTFTVFALVTAIIVLGVAAIIAFVYTERMKIKQKATFDRIRKAPKK